MTASVILNKIFFFLFSFFKTIVPLTWGCTTRHYRNRNIGIKIIGTQAGRRTTSHTYLMGNDLLVTSQNVLAAEKGLTP